jgi:PilZ domain
VPDRRRYRRVPVSFHGRFMSEDKQEYPCEVVSMSAGGTSLLAPSSSCGARLAHRGLCRKSGTPGRHRGPHFRGRLRGRDHKASTQKRERIANLLTWYINRDLLGADGRQHERFAPRVASQKLILPNGDVHDCRVIDVSLSGASIATMVKPPVDSVVVLGRLRGVVVRHHDEGVAIQFAELQDPDSLARTFG